MRRWLQLCLVIALAATSCTGGDADSSDPDAAISWKRCGDIECGTLTVPLNHDEPTGSTIDLALTRAQATGDKIGSVVMNFGGPSGESGELMAEVGEYFVAVFGGRFDVVSWDVRGVGETERLQCEALRDENFVVGLIRPDDGLEDELADEVDAMARLAECAAESGPIIDHLSTSDAARDLDLLRAAVGDDQLTFVGFSYGTMIGWVYATLFPDGVRAMVLDGAAPPDVWTVDGSLRQVAGFETAFDEFVAWCDRSPQFCDDGDEGLDQLFDRLVTELDDNPIDLGNGESFEAHELVKSVVDVMYQTPEDIGPALNLWLRDADDGDPSGLIEYASVSAETLTPGTFKAVLCADGFTVDSVEESRDYITRSLEVAPRFGLANSALRCDLWPGKIKGLPELDTAGAPTLLVVGNTLDPATPYEAAVALDGLLADSVLLTFDGAGHTIVGANSCIDAFVLDYLVNLRPPPAGQRCT